MKRTLSEFLRNGRLGGLQFGASKVDVRRLLGGPVRGGGGPPADAPVWASGALQVAFDGGRVVAIAVVFREPLPRRLRLAGWWPSRATTFRELTNYLQREDIPYRMAIPSDAQIALQVGRAGVRFALEGAVTSIESIRVANS